MARNEGGNLVTSWFLVGAFERNTFWDIQYVYLLSYGELDEKIDTTLYSTINIKLPPAAV